MNLKLHRMMNMHSKCENMQGNGMFNALIYINSHVNTSKSFMLSIASLCNLANDSTTRKETNLDM